MFKGISSAVSSVTGFGTAAPKSKAGSLLANEGGLESDQAPVGNFEGKRAAVVNDAKYQAFEETVKSASNSTPKSSGLPHSVAQVPAGATSGSQSILKHGGFDRTGLRALLAQSEIDARDADKEAPEYIGERKPYEPPTEEEVLAKKTPASTPPTSRSTSPGSQPLEVGDLLSFNE